MRLLEGHSLNLLLLLLLGWHGSVGRLLPLRHLLLLLGLLCPLLILLWLCQGLSRLLLHNHLLLLHLMLYHGRLLVLHPFRLHPNIHRQLLQSLLQGGNIIVRFERGGRAVERFFQAFGHLGQFV